MFTSREKIKIKIYPINSNIIKIIFLIYKKNNNKIELNFIIIKIIFNYFLYWLNMIKLYTLIEIINNKESHNK